MSTHAEDDHLAVTYKTYFLVWAALVVLTVATVLVGQLRLPVVGIIAAMAIAVGKAGLVAAIFMHLWYERNRTYVTVMGVALGLLVIFVGLTFVDLGVRY